MSVCGHRQQTQARDDLQSLLELYGRASVETMLDVHRTTVDRWAAGKVKIPGKVHQAIRHLLGHLPGTAGKWRGWSFHEGKLVAPNGFSYSPHDVTILQIHRDLIAAQETRIKELSALVEKLTRDLPAHDAAANDATDALSRRA